jgi:CCR4-NOT transcription complex subunit 1
MDLCVQSCAATAKPHPSPVPVTGSMDLATGAVPTPRNRLTYTGVDALSKLVYVLVKVAENTPAKIALFSKLIAIFARTLIRDADANGAGCTAETAAAPGPLPEVAMRFDQRPYLRLFTNLLRDMHQQAPQPAVGADDGAVEQARTSATDATAFNAQILASFANVLHAVKPERVPGFAFAWMEMFCHRHFLPALLSVPGQRGWPLVHRLLVDLLRFLYPHLRRGDMIDSVKLLYKSLLRLLLVLNHDFPEFLADYCNTLVDVVPPSCLQLRNLMLAAVPKALPVRDPFQSYGDSLPEFTVLPRTLSNPADALFQTLRDEVDAYLKTRSPAIWPTTLVGALKASIFAGQEEQSYTLSRYSLVTINALVLYVAHATLQRLQDEHLSSNPSHARGTVQAASIIAASNSSAAAEILRYLLVETDAEGRYAVLNAMTNQLRYANAHMFFFSRLLLSLFVSPTPNASLAEVVREQLTRVMLERLVVHRPHPWGLLVTFFELLKNPTYKFWSHGFTKMNAELENLLESVARSCMVAPAAASKPIAA